MYEDRFDAHFDVPSHSVRVVSMALGVIRNLGRCKEHSSFNRELALTASLCDAMPGLAAALLLSSAGEESIHDSLGTILRVLLHVRILSLSLLTHSQCCAGRTLDSSRFRLVPTCTACF
jgi:hypothetical protein